MKKLGIGSVAFMVAFLIGITSVAFGQDGIIPPSGEEIKSLLDALGGVKGLSALAVAGLVVQVIMLLIRSGVGGLLGKFRLIVVYGLSIVSGVLALHLSGVDISAALVHANTLAAFQVFLNQIFKQFFQKAD